MSARGRKIIPMDQKKAKGTYRAYRDNHSPPPSIELPTPPDHLSDLEREYFDAITIQLLDLGQASKTFNIIHTMCAIRLAEVHSLGEVLEEEGRWLEVMASNGEMVKKKHPAVAQRNEAMVHAHRLLVEMGLTQLAALKLPGKKASGKKNEFEEF